jgi:Putative DNA-binding domain
MNTADYNLADLQQAFQSAILQLSITTPGFIIDTNKASSAERFKVYADAYRLRLVDALIADYPTLKKYLGEERFKALGRAYIDASPSDQFSVRWFGRHMPRFLAETQSYAEQSFLKELAIFEWALSEAFDAAESILMDYKCLAAIEQTAWPLLQIQFHPSIRRINLHWNAPQVWQAANQQESPPFSLVNSTLQAWIVWRQDLKVLFRSLTTPEAFAVDAFIQGQCFEEVCTGLSLWMNEEQVVTNAAGYLQAWLRDGWIADVKLKNR